MRRSPIRPVSDKRRAMLAAHGIKHIASTLVSLGRSDTGPPRRVRRAVARRSGGICEWPGCWAAATDMHHRLNRKSGGRHGEMQELINEPEWLLHACRMHHNLTTSPFGPVRKVVMEAGWLLLEGQDAAAVLVLTRHDLDPVRLLRSGLLEVPS